MNPDSQTEESKALVEEITIELAELIHRAIRKAGDNPSLWIKIGEYPLWGERVRDGVGKSRTIRVLQEKATLNPKPEAELKCEAPQHYDSIDCGECPSCLAQAGKEEG